MARKQDSKKAGASRVRAECFLLCDFAQAENGKLYIMGGGWDEVAPPQFPLSFSPYVALKLVIPGTIALDSVSIRVDFVDQDGQPVGEPALDGRIRARPITELIPDARGLLPEAPALLALSTELTLNLPGIFTLRLLVNDELIATASLRVSPPVIATDAVDGADGNRGGADVALLEDA